MLNPLLIQLFGREVIEKLAAAGFESCASIADAGVERLAEESGITPTLARRIIAVAMEEPREADDLPETAVSAVTVTSPETVATPTTTAAPKATPAPKAARKRPAAAREQTWRQPARSARTSGAAANAGAKAKAATGPKIDIKPPESDPFVDEVGLVRWMGLAGMGGGGLDRSITVADEILDSYPLAIVDEHHPAAPPRASSEPAGATAADTPAAASEPPADAIPDSSRALAAVLFSALADEPAMAPQPAARPGAMAYTTIPEPPARAAVAAPAPTPSSARPAAAAWPAERTMQRPARPGANTALVAGSFWSFGVPPPPKTAQPASRPPSPPAPPRRRSQDGH